MKLYVCYGTFKWPRPGGGHPCHNAYEALREAGHDPDVELSYGLGILPKIFNRTSGRREAERLTGNRMVPVLVLDDGNVLDGSHAIVDWAAAHPA